MSSVIKTGLSEKFLLGPLSRDIFMAKLILMLQVKIRCFH